MIQDIKPHQYDITYRNAAPKENDSILVCQNGGVLCRIKDNEILYPMAKELTCRMPNLHKKAKYLFCIDEKRFFGLWEETVLEFGDWTYLPKEKFRAVTPNWKAYAGITGFQICKWYRENQFCGTCGTTLQMHDRERALQCPNCGRVWYPQICPSVIVAVTNGDQILLTKYADGHSNYKKYALVAGYVEVGESLEDTVRREVMEEVGLKVKNIRYYKSQPWAFTDTILMGFFCEVEGDSKITIDKEELSVAEWFEKDAIPQEHSEASVSLTGEMIEAFQKCGNTLRASLYAQRDVQK